MAKGIVKKRTQPLGWDIVLTLLTSLTLMFFGILCLYGMFTYKFDSTEPGWSVAAYQGMMNRLAAPIVISLIIWLVLCIPKRLFSKTVLFAWSAAVLAASGVAGLIGGIVPALAFALVLSSILQVVILVLVLIGARLRFTRRGMAVRIGSSFIHLGFVLLILDIILLQGSRWHLPLFWICTVLMTGGCAMTFYFPRRR